MFHEKCEKIKIKGWKERQIKTKKKKQKQNVFCSVSRDGSVGTVTGLDSLGIRVRFPVREEVFSLISTASRTALGPTQTSTQWAQGVKRPGREADRVQYVFMAWYLIKYVQGQLHFNRVFECRLDYIVLCNSVQQKLV
jgi:hypothetical protein